MSRTTVDLYRILQVDRNASGEELKRSYRRLARQYHPDVSSEEDAAERFKEINLAYEVLSDPEKRSRYDQFGTVGGASDSGMGDPFGGGFSSVGDIFDFFFGGAGSPFGGGQRRPRDYQPGDDIQRAVHLTLLDCLNGKTVTFDVERREPCSGCHGSRSQPGSEPLVCGTCGGRGIVQQVRDTLLGRIATQSNCPRCGGEGSIISDPCSSCRGTGFEYQTRQIEVGIPPGVDNGNVMRVGGQGHAGRGGAPPGDLLVAVSVAPDKQFTRNGADIMLDLPVHYADLVLGANVEVPTLTGTEQLRIPAGTQSHHTFTLRGHGLPRLRGGGRGNLMVRTVLLIPGKHGKEQKELLTRLRELETGNAKSAAAGLLGGLLGKKSPGA
jgi:molecular chaperone DnaJ